MRRLPTLFLVSVLLTLATAAAADADYGLSEFDVTYRNEDGSPATQAGSHPFSMTTSLRLKTVDELDQAPDGEIKDLFVDLPEGFSGIPSAVPTCATKDFITRDPSDQGPECDNATAVGVVIPEVLFPGPGPTNAVYNLAPPPGAVAKFGFWTAGVVPVTIDIGVSPDPPYNLEARLTNVNEPAPVYGSELTIWGNPASPAHDEERGFCALAIVGDKCPTTTPQIPLLTLPPRCDGPLVTGYQTDSWREPGALLPGGIPDLADPRWDTGFSQSHDDGEPPAPLGTTGCGRLDFKPSIGAKLTTGAAESASGLDFNLDLADEDFDDVDGLADSHIEKAVVTLPEGMTVNPSSAEGLGSCSESELDGRGCPDASKLGSLEVETPALPGKVLHGSIFLAEPYANPTGGLIALYFVIADEALGIHVVQAAKVDADPRTGRLVTTTEDMPQVPFSHFRLHFRDGARAPLLSPPTCGKYSVSADLYPRSEGAPTHGTSTFSVDSGPAGSPCPAGGAASFSPGFEAGTTNNAAGRYSPFYMRLTRQDGDQDLTRFSAALPPGVVAKLAGTTTCPEAAIVMARLRSGRHAGEEELASPSCPPGSEIGRVSAGAGVGSVLTHVPGKIYLAGPYNGAPLSAVAIVPAVAGPFDIGVVVTRFALRVDPRTTKVTIDGAASDPIPRILAGVPLKARDIRAYVDRPEFTLNPTSCEPSAVAATLWGGGADPSSSFDDSPLTLTSRFQAADCAALGFEPGLRLKLSGGTKRSSHPALRGEFRPRPGDANLKNLAIRFPHAVFLDQGHIRTICTRVQFAADGCPPGAVYGRARAWTPLLEQPLEGPVYLRSSSNLLPDLVADLHGLIDVEAVARIDSKNQGIRATFTDVPDAPLSKVVVSMQGGKKGLMELSTDICTGRHRVAATYRAHNGKRSLRKLPLRAGCGPKRQAKG